YTLGGGIDPERQWGRADESWKVKEELTAYGAEPTWFGLGDRDIATHLVRSTLLAAGHTLSEVTARLCERWQPGITLLPASDDRVETHVVIEDRAIHFQEWWIKHRAALPAKRFVFLGAEAAKPAAGVLEALAAADVILMAPSNPVVSIAPILAIPGIREALKAPVVGVSPIIGGAPVRGMADKCLSALDVECTSAGVGNLYGPLLTAWLVDTVDADTEVAAVKVVPTPLWMTDEAATVRMVEVALDPATTGSAT
ncbi:MAG TPA: 2-phospho-L-lactate transferase, partial [Micromonosporaceae bacterium]|nr:2-phospho-L-lactate transferase [Micromonosporaceae bacterium]